MISRSLDRVDPWARGRTRVGAVEGKRSWVDTPSRVDPGNLISWPPPHPPPSPTSWSSDLPPPPLRSPPLPGLGFSSHQPDSLLSTQGKRLPPPGCFQEAPGQAPALFGPHSRHPRQPDTMKSSGPVERLLRALGRRDSSRATSRVGVPVGWAEEGQGWRCGQWGRGPGLRPDPLPISTSAAFSPYPASPCDSAALGWPGLGHEQQKFGLEQTLVPLLAPLSHSLPGLKPPLHPGRYTSL